MEMYGMENTPDMTPMMGTGDAVGMQEAEENASGEALQYWLIARVAPNTEKSTATKLKSLGYDVFVASQKELRIWKNGERRKRKWVDRVVITQYIFMHITMKQREEVIRYSFVKAFLKDSAAKNKTAFAVVSDNHMASLKAMFGQSDYPVAFSPSDFHIGEKVCIHLGNYDYTAQIVRKRGDKTSYYGIRINELGCAYIEVPSSAIDKI